MKYLILLLALFMVSNVNAYDARADVKRILENANKESLRKDISKNFFFNSCLRENMKGERFNAIFDCIITFNILLQESSKLGERGYINSDSDLNTILYLTAIRVKHHTCKRIQKLSNKSASNDSREYYNELYNEFCTYLQKDYTYYEKNKRRCSTNDSSLYEQDQLLCFTYKFE